MNLGGSPIFLKLTTEMDDVCSPMQLRALQQISDSQCLQIPVSVPPEYDKAVHHPMIMLARYSCVLLIGT
jgi:hypothetical protein